MIFFFCAAEGLFLHVFSCLSLCASPPNSPFHILTSPWCFACSLRVTIALGAACLCFSLCLFRSMESQGLHEEGKGILRFHFTRREESRTLPALCRDSTCFFPPAWHNEIPPSGVQQNSRSILAIALLHSRTKRSGYGK